MVRFMTMDSLARVRIRTAERRSTEQAWRKAIRDAHKDGVSLRKIGAAAGVSHVRVLQLLRG
jgi:hypothetical protein